MDFEVYIVGSNSAVSMHGRFPTAQAVQVKNHWFLVDCGEGTQVRLLQYGVKAFRINHIFISHLHGDHYFGLIGLLTTFHLLKRKEPLSLFAPPELQAIIALQLEASHTILNYELVFVETKADHLRKIFENEAVEVYSFPLKHKIPTTGYLFREKPGERPLDMEKLKDIDIDKKYFKPLKQGLDAMDRSGNAVRSSEVTLPHKPVRSYAFCSDTMLDERIIPVIREVDLLYHEATFLQEDRDRALETGHTTALEAAKQANTANVKRLLIGHYSSRYTDLSPLLEEARSEFPNTELALEGRVFQI